MADPLGIGIVGCGNVLPHYLAVARTLERQGRARIVIACDHDEQKRDHLVGELGIPRFTTAAEQVIAAPDVDVVVVLTPMQAHAPLVCAALEARKHVLVEKMLAPTLEEAARVLAVAARSPGRLICAPHVLLSATYQKMWRRARSGEIGKISTARARYGWADPYWEGAWVYQRGAGALFEFACYNVTSLTGLLGPARRVTAMSGIALPERAVAGRLVRVEEEDNAQVLIDFGESVLAVVTSGFNLQRYRGPALELYGAGGTMQLLGDDWAPRGHELWRNSAGCWTLFEESDPGWSWADGLRHLVDCIERRVPPLSSPEHAYHVLEILLKARAASATGRTQTVESTFVMPDLTIPAS